MFGFSGSKAFGLATVLMLVFAGSAIAAQPRVGLGTAESFAILAGSEITNTGPSVILGDVGVSPGTSAGDFSGAPEGTVFGSIYTAGAAAPAKAALTTAYNDAAGRIPPIDVPSGEIGGSVLTPGVYNASSTLGLTGNVTLNGLGDPNAVFIFQVGSGLTTATDSSVSSHRPDPGVQRLLADRQHRDPRYEDELQGHHHGRGFDHARRRRRRRGQAPGPDRRGHSDQRHHRAATVCGGHHSPQRHSVRRWRAHDPVAGPGASSGGDNTGPSTRITGPSGVFGPPSRRTTRPRVGSDCVKRNFSASVRLRDGAGIRSVRVYLDGKRVKSTKRTRFSLRINVRGLKRRQPPDHGGRA